MQGDFLPRIVGAAAFVMPFAVTAETTAVGDQPLLATATVNPIVVTPTLTARTVDDSLSSVTVIDRERIDRQQPRELSDLLRGQPGIDLTSNGAFGKNTSVFTRGTGSESTVLLIDGIRMNSATGGAPAWQFLPPQLLDRVEIVRGPRSSIYGSDAVGGVIQAFTPEGDGEPSPWVQLGAGSFQQQEIGAGVSGSEGRTRYSIAHNYFETDGIRIREGDERKGFRNNATVGRLSHGFEAGPEVGLTGFRSSGTTEFDRGRTDYTLQALGGRLQLPLTAWWDALLTLSESRDEAETEDAFGFSRFDTRRREARLQNHVYFGDHELVIGGDFRRDTVTSTTDFDERRRDNSGAFAQLFLDGGDFDVQLAGRFDDNDAFGQETTGSVAIGYRLDPVHRVRGSIGTAFRAPTFNDLFFPGFGNPDLSPERSRSGELGLRANHDTWFWDLSVYQTDVRNLIVFDSASFRPENVDRARIRGAELATGASIEDWTLQAALTVTDPRDRDTRNRIRRRSTHSMRLEADRELGAVSVGATALYQGDRYDDAANTDRLSGFGLVNLRASWEFAENWSTRLTVDNVLDRDYAVARFSDGDLYQQAGRSAFLSVRYGHR